MEKKAGEEVVKLRANLNISYYFEGKKEDGGGLK